MTSNSQHAKPLDVVIKTYGEHLQPFLQLQRDLLRHSRLSGNVYVIVSQRDYAKYESVVDASFQLLTIDTILQPFGYTKTLADTWHTQQVIKLLAAGTVAHEQYLIIDANTLLNFDFNEDQFFRGGRYLYAWGEFSDRKWETKTKEFLGLKSTMDDYGFRSVNQIFYKANVFRLVEYLEKKYSGNIVDVLNTPEESWTEFKLYGYFARCLLEDSGHFFQVCEDVVSLNKGNEDTTGFINWLKFTRPLMVKVYKQRPRFRLTDSEYEALVAKVKRAY